MFLQGTNVRSPAWFPLVVTFAVAVFLQTPGWPQAPTAPSTAGTRPASPVYPLDAVVQPPSTDDSASSTSSPTVWIVDRNVPGVWRYQQDQLELAVAGDKKFRKPLNAVRCIAISPTGVLTVGDPATREIYRRNDQGEMLPTVGGLIGIPVDLAYASNGTLYIADVERRVIWKQDSAETKPTIFAHVNPRGLFVDSQDRLWVISQDEKQLLRFNPDSSQEVIVSERVFEFPHQVVVDSQERVWITDGYKKALWVIPRGGRPEIAFSGEPFQNPVGLFLIDDMPGIVDPHARQVFRFRDGKPEPWIRIEPKPSE